MTVRKRAKGFVRIIRRSGHWIRLVVDKLLQMLDRGVELRVLTLEGCVRKIIDDDVRIDAMAFDQPGALWSKDSGLAGRCDPAIRQIVAGAEPDLAAPRSGADNFPESQAPETLCKRLAVRARPLIAQDDDVASERLLHVPIRLADPWLPVHPGLSDQLAENPAINVTATVVANVDDQPVPIEDWS